MTEASALPLKESKASQNTRGQQKSSITRGKDRFILLHPLKKKELPIARKHKEVLRHEKSLSDAAIHLFIGSRHLHAFPYVIEGGKKNHPQVLPSTLSSQQKNLPREKSPQQRKDDLL